MSMSERASRAHRARRLGTSHSPAVGDRRANEAVPSSSARSSHSINGYPVVAAVESPKLDVPKPVTPDSRSSNFLDADMIDEDVPMDELENIRKTKGVPSTPPKELRRYSPAAAVTPLPEAQKGVATPPKMARSPDSYGNKARAEKQQQVRDFRQSPRQAQRQPRSLSAYLSEPPKIDAADRGGGHLVPPDDASSSVGSTSPSIIRLTSAIRRRATQRPTNLTIEEKGLWDVVQATVEKQRSEMLAKRRILERRLQESTSQVDKLRVHNLELQRVLDETTTHLQNKKRELHNLQQSVEQNRNTESKNNEQTEQLEKEIAELQRKYTEAVELAENQQEEHDRAIRAIQRVMADVQQTKEDEMKELQDRIQELQDNIEARGGNATPAKLIEPSDVSSLRAGAQRAFDLEREIDSLKATLAKVERERDELEDTLEQQAGKLATLESELKGAQNAVRNAREKEVGLLEVISRQRKLLDDAPQTPISNTSGADETETVKSLHKMLAEKTKSLENAKKLITSLEVANGSMATDLRAKLKDKEEQVAVLRSDAESRKRMVDSLATELKNAQTDKVNADQSGAQMHLLQRRLGEKLEEAIRDLESVSVVLESVGTADEDAVDKISVILCNSLMALKMTVREMEEPGDNDKLDVQRAKATERDEMLNLEVQRLNQKLRILEMTLKKAEGEMTLMKIQNDRLQLEKVQEEEKLQEEIKYLRAECRTNMEVLAKKEQELSVLRDSLEVSDGVGYISGESDEEDDDNQGRRIRTSVSHDTCASNYSASKAEALATLLIHSGTGVEVTRNVSSSQVPRLQAELKKAQRDSEKAAKELQIERESLANAKMIISSLEKANKTMLEDLRSRLQDSNTAITALLDKSMVNETSCKTLEAEINSLKEDKKRMEEEHKAEIAKLKDEALVSGLRLAAKDREINALMEMETNGIDHNNQSAEV